MRTNLSPLFRSSIGFDHLFDLLEGAPHVQLVETWPPYNIEKAGEEHYRIVMALPGCKPDDLEIVEQANLLVVSGRTTPAVEGAEVLHRGIGTGAFERKFQLADYIEVAGADLADGLLVIDLVRNVPEAMKPKRIPLQVGSSPSEPRRIARKQAA